MESFPDLTRSQITAVFARALSKVFLISIAFPGHAFILAFFDREIKLRTELETEFGLEERDTKKVPKRSEFDGICLKTHLRMFG